MKIHAELLLKKLKQNLPIIAILSMVALCQLVYMKAVMHSDCNNYWNKLGLAASTVNGKCFVKLNEETTVPAKAIRIQPDMTVSFDPNWKTNGKY